jgi:hypothetical protein
LILLYFQGLLDEINCFDTILKLNKLCQESPEGYIKTINILNTNQILNNEKLKFKFIIDMIKREIEIKNEDKVIELLTFINNIIKENRNIDERKEIIDEFVQELNIDNILNNNDSTLINQLMEQFNSFRDNNLLYASNLILFKNIYSKIVDKPQQITFQSILNQLLLTNDDKTWLKIEESIKDLNNLVSLIPTPPPLPNIANDESKITMPPPAPPLINFLNNNSFESTNETENINEELTSTKNDNENDELPQQTVPRPNYKMKQLIWSKIHPNRIINGKQNIWTKFKNRINLNCLLFNDDNNKNDNFANRQDDSYLNQIEDLFKITTTTKTTIVDNLRQFESINLNQKDQSLNRLWSSSEKINLIDTKRSLNINIYLKQFRWFVS